MMLQRTLDDAIEHVIQTETRQRENSPEFKSDRTRTDLPVVKKHSAVCNRGNATLKQILATPYH